MGRTQVEKPETKGKRPLYLARLGKKPESRQGLAGAQSGRLTLSTALLWEVKHLGRTSEGLCP